MFQFPVNIIIILLLFFIALIGGSLISTYLFIQKFHSHCQKLGLKVYKSQFNWTGSGVFRQYKRSYDQYGDANYHYKNKLPKYDAVIFNTLNNVILEIGSPELFKQFIAKSNDGYYQKIWFLLFPLIPLMKRDNLLFAEGQQWKNRKKLLSKVFNYDLIKSKIPQICSIYADRLDSMEKQVQLIQGINGKQITYDIGKPLTEIFTAVILKCFFKIDQNPKINELVQNASKENLNIIEFINQLFAKIDRFSMSNTPILAKIVCFFLKIRKNDQEIHKDSLSIREAARKIIIKRIKEIKEKEKQVQNSNICQDIVEAVIKNKCFTEEQNSQKNDEQKIDIETLINQFCNFTITGSQTTMNLTRMMIYRLATNQDIFKKVEAQIMQVVKSQKGVTYQQLGKLTYLEYVQKEVLRMDSSVGFMFTRKAMKDHYLGSMKINKGLAICGRLKMLHFKEQYFNKPLEFMPERWDKDRDQPHKKHPYAFMPFSAGMRACIGQQLSLLQNKIFMVQLIRRYEKIVIQRFPRMKPGVIIEPQPILTTFVKRTKLP